MSGPNNWLKSQRKADLADLAEQLGFEDYEKLKKTELEEELDEYLAQNANTHQSDPQFAPYYASRARAVGSPMKADAPAPRNSKRRTMRASEDPSIDEMSASSHVRTSGTASSTLATTPGRALSLARRISLPSSPHQVAEAVELSTVAVRERVVSLYQDSRVPEATAATREILSTLHSVLIGVTVFEACLLRMEVLPDRYVFTIPAIAAVGTPHYPVELPDLFLLATASFWSPFLTWMLTSIVLPSLVGYFVNLSAASYSGRTSSRLPQYAVDPLAFSIVKAMAAFVVYGQGYTIKGLLNEVSITRIDSVMYCGWQGIATGAAITGLLSIYDAVLNK